MIVWCKSDSLGARLPRSGDVAFFFCLLPTLPSIGIRKRRRRPIFPACQIARKSIVQYPMASVSVATMREYEEFLTIESSMEFRGRAQPENGP